MADLRTPRPPRGYDLIEMPTRGGQSAQAYSQLAQFLPELMNQARGGTGAFDAIEGPAKRFYEQQLAPGIAQRYAGSGISGSSGMQNALVAGAADITTNLAAQRAQLMQQSMKNVLGLGDMLLSRPDYTYDLMEQGPSGWDQFLGVGLPVGGALLGGIFGGPMGAEWGGRIGSRAGSAFL